MSIPKEELLPEAGAEYRGGVVQYVDAESVRADLGDFLSRRVLRVTGTSFPDLLDETDLTLRLPDGRSFRLRGHLISLRDAVALFQVGPWTETVWGALLEAAGCPDGDAPSPSSRAREPEGARSERDERSRSRHRIAPESVSERAWGAPRRDQVTTNRPEERARLAPRRDQVTTERSTERTRAAARGDQGTTERTAESAGPPPLRDQVSTDPSWSALRRDRAAFDPTPERRWPGRQDAPSSSQDPATLRAASARREMSPTVPLTPRAIARFRGEPPHAGPERPPAPDSFAAPQRPPAPDSWAAPLEPPVSVASSVAAGARVRTAPCAPTLELSAEMVLPEQPERTSTWPLFWRPPSSVPPTERAPREHAGSAGRPVPSRDASRPTGARERGPAQSVRSSGAEGGDPPAPAAASSGVFGSSPPARAASRTDNRFRAEDASAVRAAYERLASATWFEVLGACFGDSPRRLEAARERRLVEFGPGSNADLASPLFAARIVGLVEQAWSLLRDPATRQSYRRHELGVDLHAVARQKAEQARAARLGGRIDEARDLLDAAIDLHRIREYAEARAELDGWNPDEVACEAGAHAPPRPRAGTARKRDSRG